MSEITSNIAKLGNGLQSFLTNEKVLYVFYFFAFFFMVYTLINTSLQKVGNHHFKGKAGKVIAFMVSLISTGAIFYGNGSRSAKDLVEMFNGFGWFILGLILGIGMIALGIYFFLKLKEKSNFEKDILMKNYSYFILCLFLMIGTFIIYPLFGTNDNNEVLGFGGKHFGTVAVIIAQIDSIAIYLSVAGTIIFGFMALSGLFESGDSSSIGTSLGNNEKADKKEKDIEKVKKLTEKALQDLEALNVEFAEKTNKLSEVRSHLNQLQIEGPHSKEF